MSLLSFCTLVFSSQKYAVIVDAGSSATRYSIYWWNDNSSYPTVSTVPDTLWRYSIRIRLADAAANMSLIPVIFRQMVETSSLIIPPSAYDSTLILVYGTGGMRLLSPASQVTVMTAVIDYLSTNSPFNINTGDIRVIEGYEEGLFGWIAVNNLLSRFPGNFQTGFTEMGGASLQLTFRLGEQGSASDKDLWNVKIGPETYRVFSTSYLGYGLDQALARITANLPDNNHPCMTADYIYETGGKAYLGTGDWTQCLELIDSVLLKSPDFSDVVIPPRNYAELYGISIYGNVIQFLGLPPTVTLEQLWAASLEFLELNWSTASAKWPNDSYLNVIFMDCCYVYGILTQGFKQVDTGTTFTFPMDIEGVTIGYPLGAVLARIWDVTVDKEKDKGIPTWALALIIVGAILVAGGILTLWLCCCCRNCGCGCHLQGLVPVGP
jgi:Golgi nucleoside diphosphatase